MVVRIIPMRSQPGKSFMLPLIEKVYFFWILVIKLIVVT